ncbi:MAG: hypothetical protein K0S81_1611 [Rhodospirillales bacterium]|jgi:uncharacterized protein with GYD domain|nr:hypothetical protein [Rhodospirillales bacterium]
MARYLIQFTYTQKSMKALIDRPHDRTEAAQRSIEGFGGRLIFYAYCFGEWDGIAIAEFPNHEAAMASLLALNSAGALSKTQTTVLLSSEETVRSMQKAHDTKTGYTPPG